MSSALQGVTGIDIAGEEAYEHGIPHERFALLRRHDPVYWHPWYGERGGFWAVTRHADVAAVSRDPGTFSSARGHVFLWDLEPERLETHRSLIELDPPAHTRLRRLVAPAFTPRKVREQAPAVRAVVTSLLDGLQESEEVDLVDALAAPLSLGVISTLLGIPKKDRPVLARMTGTLAHGRRRSDRPPSPWALLEYGRRVSAARRRRPGPDLLSQLLAVCPDGEGLSDEECAGVFRLLMHAGSETQGAAVSLGLLALIEHPLELDRVQRDRSLAPTALEEILRFTSPILHFRRTATRDTELRGVPIAAGEKVVVWYCSANFDEEVFEDPYRFDVGRSPNDHVALGAGGPHFCLGAALAQLELRVLLEEILERGLRFELCGPPRWGRPSFVHGLVSLPVRVRTRRHTSAGRR